MSVAVIATGGKQYVVHEGDELEIERLETKEDGSVDFSDLLNGKTVSAKVTSHPRADKVRIVKYKSKVRYLRRAGHRQLLTRIRVEKIA